MYHAIKYLIITVRIQHGLLYLVVQHNNNVHLGHGCSTIIAALECLSSWLIIIKLEVELTVSQNYDSSTTGIRYSNYSQSVFLFIFCRFLVTIPLCKSLIIL